MSCLDATKKSSYGQILKSSSIIGGAQGANYLISMVKMKLVAVLLGPSGVGLVGLYVSATELVGTLAGLGLGNSGVREIAEAHGTGDEERISRAITTLRRACLVTGVLSWLLTAALSYPLSLWVFNSGAHALEIAVLGVTLTFGQVSGGQSALLQGTRRIGDFARLNVLGALAGTLIAVALYAWLGSQGIVPVLIATAAVNLGFTWRMARRIKTVRIDQSWLETLEISKRLVNLGVAFMYGGLLATIVGLVLRVIIVRNLGLDSNGIYQAAWSISGMFAGFIINAMCIDFYPRLTAVSHDNAQLNRLVNEQLEIGVLLALPGLIGTIVFAPWLMHLFYSAKFLPGAALLPWFVAGVFGQVINFPIGMTTRAKGSVRWIYIGQTEANVVHLGLCVVLVPLFGVVGAGYAFAIHNLIHGIVVNMIAAHLTGFSWGLRERRLVFTTLLFVLVGCFLKFIPNDICFLTAGALLFTVALVFSLRGIVSRVGAGHPIAAMARKIPFGRFVFGL